MAIEFVISDKSGLIKQLDAFPQLQKVGMARAINRTADWAKTRLVRMAREILTAPVADLRANVHATKAAPQRLRSDVTMEGKRIGLMKFKGKPALPPTRHGIQYQILRDGSVKSIFHGAFTAVVHGKAGFWKRASTERNVHVKVIAKSGKRAGKWIWSQNRINPLFGPSAVVVLEGSEAFKKLTQTEAPERLALQVQREASFLLTGTSKVSPGGES